METVNIVATGTLNFDELDIEQLYNDIGGEISELKLGRLDVNIDDGIPLVMVYPSGTFTIPGASSLNELNQTRSRFIGLLDDVSGGDLSERSFSIKYKVFMSDLDSRIDLETLAIKLGLENVEYEPEQFPGLIYRVTELNGVSLIFSSGKVLFTGFEEKQEAEVVEKELKQDLRT